MTVHRVHSLPEGGQYTRCKCGFRTNDIKSMAMDRASAPQGADLCGKCWRDAAKTTLPGKLRLIEQITEAAVNGFVPAADIRAILEDRYYPEDRSPKAA